MQIDSGPKLCKTKMLIHGLIQMLEAHLPSSFKVLDKKVPVPFRVEVIYDFHWQTSMKKRKTLKASWRSQRSKQVNQRSIL